MDRRRALQSAAVAGVLLAHSLPAEAGRGAAPQDDYVVAESRFGNGTVVGPVRRTRVGWQVQTPGGNWLYCERSCSETLRVNTVDFWQNREGAGDNAAIDQQDGLLSRWLTWPRRD
jgi:hypothetical protein